MSGGLPPDMAGAALSVLLHARLVCEDWWPTPRLIIRHARLWNVPADALAAMFGLLRTDRGRWIDVAGGTHPEICGPPATSEDAKTYFAFWRAFARTVGAPAPPIARLH